MLLEALTAAGDLGRLHEIGRVLARHGLGDILQRTGVANLLRRAGRVVHVDVAARLPERSFAERLRRAFEDLGPTFVKLGQLLAGRRDLLPPDWIDEFARLQEHVAPVPWDAIAPQLEADLGAPAAQVFDDLDTEPLAAGSIAQVHTARLGGAEVVLKVRRPGIDEKVAADLRLVARLAELLEREEPELRRYRPRHIARQFARTLKAELDLRVEARHLAAIAANLRPDSAVVVPTVFEEHTRERLLVMSRLHGLSASAWVRGERPERPVGLDPRHLAELGADVVLDMIFKDGLYHADPHPGNVLFLEGERIGLLDFGMVGHLSDDRRREFVTLLGAVVRRDLDAVVDSLLAWSADGATDVQDLMLDCADFIDRYRGLRLEQLDAVALLTEVTALVRENDLVLPPDVAALIKVFVTLEGLGRALDPAFDMTAHLEPVMTDLVRREYSPRAVLRRNLRELRSLVRGLPEDLRGLLMRLRRHGFRMQLDLERLDAFGARLDKSANRITVGLVTSALIVGTAIAMTVEGGPKLLGLPAFAFLGFLGSLALSAALLWSILRSGRR